MAVDSVKREDGGRALLISYLYEPKVRSVAYQLVLVLGLLLLGYEIVTNTAANLKKQNIASGLGFAQLRLGVEHLHLEVRIREFKDDGVGIADFSVLLAIAKSGWDEAVVRAESAYGAGFLATLFCCDRIEVQGVHENPEDAARRALDALAQHAGVAPADQYVRAFGSM